MRHIFDYIRKNKFLLFLIIPAFIFFMITIWRSGSRYCYQTSCGIFFWGANGHDAVWHLALSVLSFTKWPFVMPVFSGTGLTSYNFLMDLVFYVLSLVKIPVSFSYFKLFPLLWFFVYTALLIYLGRRIKDNFWFIFWLLFFAYFGSSFGYFFTLYHNKTIWGSFSLLAMQSGQNLTNLQFSLSLIFLLIIMILIKKDKPTIKTAFIYGSLIFINFGLKFYGGMVSLFMVGVYILFKKNLVLLIKSYLIIGIFAIGAIFLFFNPLNSLNSGPVFIFSPFATMHAMIEEPIYFYLKDMVNARYYLYENASLLTSPRLLFIELFSSFIFIVTSTGLRLFGLIFIVWKIIRRKINQLDLLLILSMFGCYLLLIFFIQKGIWWNIVQFYYFFLFLLNFFTAEFFYNVTNKKNTIVQILIIATAIILTLPGNLDILKVFTVFPGHSYISDSELKALDFLKKKPAGVVYASIFKKQKLPPIIPNPMYLGEDSAYIPAYSRQPLYFADLDVLNITDVNYQKRLDKIKTEDCSVFNEVNYVYEIIPRNDGLIRRCIHGKKVNLKKIFDSVDIKIYEK